MNRMTSGVATEPALATLHGALNKLMPSSALSTTAVAAFTLSGPVGSFGTAPRSTSPGLPAPNVP